MTDVSINEPESVSVEVTESVTTVEEVEGDDVIVVTVGEPEQVTIEALLIPGPQGVQGVDGAVGGAYTHTQNAPSTSWTIVHGLGYKPAVTVVDSSDRVVIGGVEYVDEDTVICTFSAAFAGAAYLS